jgi:SAM-dependent methyltransferase
MDLRCKCTVCGASQAFAPAHRLEREARPCRKCGARQRDRDQAQALLTVLSSGMEVSLASAVAAALRGCRDLRVLEIAYSSPFVPVLSRLPGYVRAYRWSSGRAEELGGRTIPHVDLERIDFDDQTFDAVITSEVMQFVRDEERAHKEILRVLRIGGAHVASIPLDWPWPNMTRELYDLFGDDPVPLGEERLFRTPDGQELPLMRRYGTDVTSKLRTIGYEASLRRSDFLSATGRRNATLVAIRVS